MSENSNIPLIIVNPKSAGGSTEQRWARIAGDLATHFGTFQVEFTRRAGHGIELARAAAEAGRKFIIACGGDGTINEIANGSIRLFRLSASLGFSFTPASAVAASLLIICCP